MESEQAVESDVDKLVAEFETGKKDGYASVKPLVDVIKPLANYVQAKQIEEQNNESNRSVAEAVSTVKSSEELKDISDNLVRGYLIDYSNRDETFRKAYENRTSSPAAWQESLIKARTDFTEEIKSASTKNIRSDIEAARAAVTTGVTSEAAVVAHDLFKMSDAAFRDYKRSLAH